VRHYFTSLLLVLCEEVLRNGRGFKAITKFYEHWRDLVTGTLTGCSVVFGRSAEALKTNDLCGCLAVISLGRVKTL
jgi:hypothetical protein